MEDFMIREGLEQGIVGVISGGIGVGAAVLRIMLTANYGSLAKASNSMAKTKKKWLRQIKLKFETMYRLEIGVHNVEAFVDKHVCQRKILGLHLSTWESISKQATLLCGLSAIGAIILGRYYECNQNTIFFTALAGVGGMALIRFVDNFSSLEIRKQQLSTNLTDYFENYSKVRLERILDESKQQKEQQENIEDMLQPQAAYEEAACSVTEEDKKTTKKYDFSAMTNRQKKKAIKEREKEVAKQAKKEMKERRKQMRMKIKEEQAQYKRLKRRKAGEKELEDEKTLEEIRRRREQTKLERKQRTLEELKQKQLENPEQLEGFENTLKKAAMTANKAEEEVAPAEEGREKEDRIASAAIASGTMFAQSSAFASNTNMTVEAIDTLAGNPQILKDTYKDQQIITQEQAIKEEQKHTIKEKQAAQETSKYIAREQQIVKEEEAASKAISAAEEIVQNINLETANKVKKQRNEKEDKLIEEVLKEFLA